jgi:hypothetical protein
MIFDVAGASACRLPGRGARVLPLEFVLHLQRPILSLANERDGVSATQQAKAMIRLEDTTGRMPRSASKQRQRRHEKLVVGSPARKNERDREQRSDDGQAPKHLHGLETGPRERFNQGDRSDRATEHPEHCGAPHLVPRRQPGDLDLDEVEILGNLSEIIPSLIGLAQRE